MPGCRVLSIILVLTFAGCVWCSVIRRSAEDDEESSFKKHMDRVLEFRCSTPQMRSLRSRELIQDLASTEFVSPEMTVLHRCDAGSGCCLGSETSTCARKEWNMVDLPFVIRDHFKRTQREVVVRAMNHTKCSCQNSFDSEEMTSTLY